MLAWLRDLTSQERRTMLACWGGWTLDGFDQQLYSYVVPTVIAVWGMSTGAAGTIGHQAIFPVAVMSRVLGVSVSGFHAWRCRPPSAHAIADTALLKQIRTVHASSRETYGAPRVQAALKAGGEKHGRPVIRCMLSLVKQTRGRRCSSPCQKGGAFSARGVHARTPSRRNTATGLILQGFLVGVPQHDPPPQRIRWCDRAEKGPNRVSLSPLSPAAALGCGNPAQRHQLTAPARVGAPSSWIAVRSRRDANGTILRVAPMKKAASGGELDAAFTGGSAWGR
jgi:hypothetical protein